MLPSNACSGCSIHVSIYLSERMAMFPVPSPGGSFHVCSPQPAGWPTLHKQALPDQFGVHAKPSNTSCVRAHNNS